jgi:hypothetical protein
MAFIDFSGAPANRLRHDPVNDEVELGRLLDRKISGLRQGGGRRCSQITCRLN